MDKTTWLITLARACLAASLFVIIFVAARIRFGKGAERERPAQTRLD